MRRGFLALLGATALSPFESKLESQLPSSRRATSPLATSSFSAVVTDARWHPTSCPRIWWVRPSGSTTPSALTLPQRSARYQNRTSSRVSTGDRPSSAWCTAIRTERRIARSSSTPVTWERASASARSRGRAPPARPSRAHARTRGAVHQPLVTSGHRRWSTSPSPSSSVRSGRPARGRARSDRRAPGSRGGRARTRSSGTSQTPGSSRLTGATSAARACPTRAGGTRSPSSGSASNTRTAAVIWALRTGLQDCPHAAFPTRTLDRKVRRLQGNVGNQRTALAARSSGVGCPRQAPGARGRRRRPARLRFCRR